MPDEDLENLIYLIQQTPLDDTIKEILVRDLKSEGLTEFMKEQINAYCLEGVKQIDERIEKAKQALNSQTPAA